MIMMNKKQLMIIKNIPVSSRLIIWLLKVSAIVMVVVGKKAPIPFNTPKVSILK